MDDQEMELYDLQADPNETKNIYSSASAVANKTGEGVEALDE